MIINMEKLNFKTKNTLISLIIPFGIIIGVFLEIAIPQMGEAEPIFEAPPVLALAVIQENSLLEVSNPPQSPQAVKKVNMIITAYSSTLWETDEDPFITASGTEVQDGVVANNLLPFGTKIRIPEIYGDRIFVVEDRMHWSKSDYHLDIWFPEYEQAKSFGAKTTYVEILEN